MHPVSTGKAIQNIHQKTTLKDQLFNNLDISEATKKDYQARIGLFHTFIQENPLNRNSFVQFKNWLKQRPDLSISSKQKYLIVAKVLLKEAYRLGHITVNITEGVKGFKQNKKHRREGLTDSEISLLMEQFQNMESTPSNDRIKALFSLLIYQGLRLVEVHRLNVSDLELPKKKAYIYGKARDDKELIHLHPIIIKVLRVYLKSNKLKDGALFRSVSNNAKNKRLSIRAMQYLIDEVFANLHIQKSGHCIRHWYVSRLVKHYKGDLMKVIGYTRHRSLEMLLVYHNAITEEEDLPNYYEAFKKIQI